MGATTKHLLFAAAALAIASLAGCGDDSDENPKPSITAGNGAGSTGTGDGAGGGGDGGGGVGGGCTGEDGCFSCEPTKTAQFLDACTDSQCSPFDNEARLPLFNGGDLPPVP